MTEPTTQQIMNELAGRQLEIATVMLARPEPTMREVTHIVETSGELDALPWWCECHVCRSCFVAGAHIAGLVRIIAMQTKDTPADVWARFMADRSRQENG